MATQTEYASASNAADNSITGRIAMIRQMQTDLRTRPVTGTLRVFKRFLYKAFRSTFWRQFNVNSATVDLVEALYREMEGHDFRSRGPGAMQNFSSTANQTHAANNAVAFSTGDVLASCGQSQDQAKLNNIRPLGGFNSVYTSPAEMRMPERVALYSLIFGMQPRNCLEIGTFRGGSSAIICGAMNDTGFGQLACVDPMPKIAPELWSQMSNRCRLFEGPSPDILSDVAKQVMEPFDFALIDANHTYDAVRRDIAGVLPYLADHAYLLFHDANYPDVKRAIDESVASCSQLTDCGLMSVEPTVLYENGQTITWAGLRLLKYQRPVRKVKAA